MSDWKIIRVLYLSMFCLILLPSLARRAFYTGFYRTKDGIRRPLFTLSKVPVKLTRSWFFIGSIPRVIHCFVLLLSELTTPGFLLQRRRWFIVGLPSLNAQSVKSVMPKTLESFVLSEFPRCYSQSDWRAVYHNAYNLWSVKCEVPKKCPVDACQKNPRRIVGWRW